MKAILDGGKCGLTTFVAMLCLLAGSAGAAQDNFVVSGIWTAPAGVTTIDVEAWGGGGAGGGQNQGTDGGGGGGGGAYSKVSGLTVIPGNTYAVTVGAGGIGVAGGTGGTGGDSYFIDITTVLATGGVGGVPSTGTPPAGGAGGAAAAGVGTIKFSGGNGGVGRNHNTGLGGPGGSSAGTAANGTSGPDPYSDGGGGTDTTAQPPPAGGGIGGDGGAAGNNGFAPASGNGGGGGGSGDGTNRIGGNGAGGKVVISYPTIPLVTAISLASTDPTAANTAVSWTVTFDQSVSGVDAGDFVLVESNGATGSSLTSVAGSGAVWTVTANTGTGASGLLGLNLVDNDSILSIDSLPLGGAGAGNGNFTGAIYTISFTPTYVFTNGACTDSTAIGVGCTAITWSSQVAGQALGNIYITNVNAAGIPTWLHKTQVRTRNIAFRLACHDPATHAGMSATFSATSLLCSPTVWSAAEVVAFPAGSPSAGPYSFIYDDVGKIELWMRDSAATTSMGASGSFVVAPDHFDLSGIQQTAVPNLVNPAAANETGAKFVKAGENFTVTVTARNALGVTTANFGQESSAEGVKLTSVLVAPAGGVNGALTGTFSAFSSGVATSDGVSLLPDGVTASTPYTWNEVGIITLTPSIADGDYLGTGDVTGTTSGNVGRFIPDHFITSITDGCTGSGFSYSGQPFTLVVTAMNGLAVPTTTVNYDGTAVTLPNFSKGVTLTVWDALTGLIPDPDGALTNSSVLAADFTQGIATLAPVYTFTSRTTAPASIRIRSDDTDAVTSSGFSEGTAEIRSGRAYIANAHGLEMHALPVQFRTEYWSGGWVLNADSCSGDGLSGGTVGVTLSAAPVTCVQDTGSPGLSGSGCAAAGPVSQRFKEGGAAGFAGDFNLWLKAPGSGNTGTVTVTGNVPVWLQYPWTGAAAVDPEASATFGIYRGAKEFIDLRENY
jgi:hypothetical protein